MGSWQRKVCANIEERDQTPRTEREEGSPQSTLQENFKVGSMRGISTEVRYTNSYICPTLSGIYLWLRYQPLALVDCKWIFNRICNLYYYMRFTFELA